MKCFTLLLILIAAVSSYASSINFSKLIKRNISFDEESFLNSLSKECREEYENSEYYKDCESSLTLTNYKKVCSDIKSEKCHNYFNDPLKYYPSCKGNSAFEEMYQPLMVKTQIQYYELTCQTDENGDLCPFSLSLITKQSGSGVLQEQCKSKKCTESLHEIVKDFKVEQFGAAEEQSFSTGSFSFDELNVMKDIASILESAECKSAHAMSSGTISNVKSTIWFIVLSLFTLLLLFY